MVTGIVATGAAVIAAGKIKEDSLLGMLYKDTLQPSVQALGKALVNTIEFCTTPMLLCKFGSEAAKLNFKNRLDRYAEKLQTIQEEQSLPVNPQIGIPILDRLTYTTNDEVAELFLNLLVKASSIETVNQAHPAFIKIIESLTPDEALVLDHLKSEIYIPFISLHGRKGDEAAGHIVIYNNQTKLKDIVSLQFSDNLGTYLDNLTSLGILFRHDDVWLSDEAIYSDLYERYYYEGIENGLIEAGLYKTFERGKGIYKITDFGKSFIQASIK